MLNATGGLTISTSKTINMGSNKITNVADPVNNQDAVTKAYADAVGLGLIPKQNCKAATTADLASTYDNAADGATLTSSANPSVALVIDTVTLTHGERVLVKDQSDSKQNGIYSLTIVGDDGTPWVLTRTLDTNSVEKINRAFTFITQGVENVNIGFIITNDGATPAEPAIGTNEWIANQITSPMTFATTNLLNLEVIGQSGLTTDVRGNLVITGATSDGGGIQISKYSNQSSGSVEGSGNITEGKLAGQNGSGTVTINKKAFTVTLDIPALGEGDWVEYKITNSEVKVDSVIMANTNKAASVIIHTVLGDSFIARITSLTPLTDTDIKLNCVIL